MIETGGEWRKSSRAGRGSPPFDGLLQIEQPVLGRPGPPGPPGPAQPASTRVPRGTEYYPSRGTLGTLGREHVSSKSARLIAIPHQHRAVPYRTASLFITEASPPPTAPLTSRH